MTAARPFGEPAADRSDLRKAAALVFVDDLATPSLDGESEHHLLDVLRLGDGDAVAVADGAGSWRLCRLRLRALRPSANGWRAVAAGQRRRDGGRAALAGERPARAELEPWQEVRSEAPRRPPIGVGFALTKGDRPEWTVQKLTELGVDEIFPLVTERCVVRLDAAGAGRRLDRLRRVAREAAAQCRRTRLPSVFELAPLDEVLLSIGRSGAVPVLAEPGSPPLGTGTTHLVVGPEGGFTDDELDLTTSRASLATLVLRAETAAIAAGCLLTAMRDGWNTG